MRRSLLLVAFLALYSVGCAPTVTVRPLYNPDDKPPADQRIEGEWLTPDVGESGLQDKIIFRWSLGSYDQSDGYTVVLRQLKADSSDNKEDMETNYHLHLLPIGDKLFFDAQFQDETVGPHNIKPEELHPGLIPAHVVGRLWIEQDFLRVAFLDSEWVMKNVPANLWIQEFGGDEKIAALTAAPEEVRSLLSREADNPEAFSLLLHFCRPGSPCAAKAIEYELARSPNDLENLRTASRLYLRLGSYPKAVELQRRLVPLQPDQRNAHNDLAFALAMNRDFEAARREFLAAEKLRQAAQPKLHPSVPWQIPWTFFLEGKYDDVLKSASGPTALDYISPEMIVLEYTSLLRLHRAAEAQVLLEKQTAAFRGLWEEHLLLLEFQNRVYGPAPAASTTSNEKNFVSRHAFFQAMRLVALGDSSKAAPALREFLKSADRDDFNYLAARIELERLGQPAAQ
jgi:tetratricopeptide (TPR) repeat protein